MYQSFKAKAEGVGAEVHRYKTGNEALTFILRFLEQEGLADIADSCALWAAPPFSENIDRQLFDSIPGVKFSITRELSAEAKFGISQLEWALADTGTLVQDASSIETRLVSSLSSIHIALVPTSGLLPDLPTLLTKVDPGKAAYIAMITGPSRTADIERVLTIGVHGPERLIIVFVDELGGAL